MSSQIEMAQDFDYRIPAGQFKMTLLTPQPWRTPKFTGGDAIIAPHRPATGLPAIDFELSRRP
jgi:hypothetical protein